MDRDTIINGLRMTMDLCVFDPSTGEEIEPHLLNDISRATYDACKGALEILERLDTDSDTISRQAAIEALHMDTSIIPFEKAREYADATISEIRNRLETLPSTQPDIIRCRECKFASGDSRICMKFGHSPIGELDFCSFAERREVTT